MYIQSHFKQQLSLVFRSQAKFRQNQFDHKKIVLMYNYKVQCKEDGSRAKKRSLPDM